MRVRGLEVSFFGRDPRCHSFEGVGVDRRFHFAGRLVERGRGLILECRLIKMTHFISIKVRGRSLGRMACSRA